MTRVRLGPAGISEKDRHEVQDFTVQEASKLAREDSITSARRTGVSVVIVVWNAKTYVLDCLNSLRDWCAKAYTDVVIVDNASTDGTAELVEEMFPEFKLIRNPTNLGFAKANNIALAQCTGEFVCLVNSDVKFTSDCITPILKYMEANPKVSLLGPKMLSADGKTAMRSTLRFPTVWNTFCRAIGLDMVFKGSRLFGGFLMSDFDHQTTSPVEVLAGWFWVARRGAIEQVGMLDTQFFMYWEDMDWCYRFWQAGERVVFFAGAEAIHYGGASSSAAPVRFFLEQCRGDWRFFRKHHDVLAQLGYLAAIAIHHALRLMISSLIYLFSPSQRPQTRTKFLGSLSCLQWVAGLGFSRPL